MNDEGKLALKAAVLDWRKKYGLQDGDPMLAAVELWEIYFSHAGVNADGVPTFEEFRSSLEQLGRLENSFSARGTELIQELRRVPTMRNELNNFPKFALIFTAGLALLLGILIGKFLL